MITLLQASFLIRSWVNESAELMVGWHKQELLNKQIKTSFGEERRSSDPN